MEDKDLHEDLVALGREGRYRVLRVLAGQGTQADVLFVNHWLREDPRRAELIQDIRYARAAAEVVPELWGDLDDAYRSLLARLDPPPAVAPGSVSAEDKTTVQTTPAAAPVVLPFQRRPAVTTRPRRGWVRRTGWAARIAATVALITGGALLWQQRETLFAPTEGPMQEVVAGVGERVRLTLADGSEVVLGPNSRLHFPEHFGRTRDLRLEGEAVFDVVSDSARPFLVHTEAAATRVLGTRFGVRAYPEDEYVEVVVAEGRVAVAALDRETMSSTDAVSAPAGSRAGGTVELTANQAVRVSGDGTIGAPRAVDATRLLAWTEGSLYFERTPLPDVARILERRYGIEIELADERVADLRLTAEFLEPELVTEVVRLIAVSLGIEYRKTATGFLFTHPAPTTETAPPGGEEP